MNSNQLAYVGFLAFVTAVAYCLIWSLAGVIRDTVHALELVIL